MARSRRSVNWLYAITSCMGLSGHWRVYGLFQTINAYASVIKSSDRYWFGRCGLIFWLCGAVPKKFLPETVVQLLHYHPRRCGGELLWSFITPYWSPLVTLLPMPDVYSEWRPRRITGHKILNLIGSLIAIWEYNIISLEKRRQTENW